MAEWLKAYAWKAYIGKPIGGSNPPSSANFYLGQFIVLYPLKFHNIFQERIWGGNLIKEYLGRTVNKQGLIGESWDICDRNDAVSVVSNGALVGKTLAELRLTYKEQLLGTKCDFNKPVPILVKILDAKEDLSLQVHPKYSNLPQLPKGACPKTEFWYVLHHQDNAEIMAGLSNNNVDAFIKSMATDKIKDFVNIYKSEKDMLLYIESGTLHAIGAGNLILEIQENSDTTYRVSDWGRLDSTGKPRELHLQESLISLDFSKTQNPNISKVDTLANYEVVNSPYFITTSQYINNNTNFSTNKESFAIVSVTSGTINLLGKGVALSLNLGDSCLIPANIHYSVENTSKKANILITTVK